MHHHDDREQQHKQGGVCGLNQGRQACGVAGGVHRTARKGNRGQSVTV
eukprot:COSAG06_NODE_66862_length_253_cov_0.675325_1_plen_47_part_01